MTDPRMEEKAALAALGWSENPATLDRAAEQDPELAQAVREFADAAAMLACDANQFEPPPALRSRIMDLLGPQVAVEPKPKTSLRLLHFPSMPRTMTYALAACLMGVALFQAALILMLDSRLDAFRASATTTHPNLFSGVQLVDLAPQGDHGDAKIMVAWNAKTRCGMVSMSDMPPAPPGNDYQLWVLDPSKPAPVSAGVVPRGVTSQHFVVSDVEMPRPGFAVSLEPAGGRSVPTTGQILFAVAPGS
jgi:anti-sigma-K factor RskA